MSTSPRLWHVGVVTALLLVHSAVQAQNVAKPQRQPLSVVPGNAGTTPQTLSLVLLSGETGGPGTTDEVPAAVRKALDDLKAFLPFNTYRLHDGGIIAAPSLNGAAVQRLRGPDSQLFEVHMSRSREPQWSLDVTVRETGADARPSPGTSSPNALIPMGGASSPNILTATVRLTAGETIVVGTSRVRGDKALILLLTGLPVSQAASPRPPAPAAGGASFSDAIARSVTVVFDTSKTVTLTGTIATAETQINRAARSFTMTDATTGQSATWAVLVRNGQTLSLKPGAMVTVTGWPARDGSRRLEASLDNVQLSAR